MGTDADGPRDAAERLRVDAQPQGEDAVLLRLEGDLDLVTAPYLRGEIARHREGVECVILDLARIEFLDSTGLVLLMESARDSASEGWRLVLRREVSRPVARLLEITRTESLFAWGDLQ